MSAPKPEVTYGRGRPIAAYYYLPGRAGQKSVRTRQLEPGLLVDFRRGGRAIGIEITDPAGLSVAAFNRVLRELGCSPVSRADVAPLRAAWPPMESSSRCPDKGLHQTSAGTNECSGG